MRKTARTFRAINYTFLLCLILSSCRTAPKKKLSAPPPLPPGMATAQAQPIQPRLAQPPPQPSVTLPGFRFNGISPGPGIVTLSWQEPPSGPTMLQARSTLTASWTNVLATVWTQATVQVQGQSFFRLQGSYPLALLHDSQPRVTWEAPNTMPTDFIKEWDVKEINNSANLPSDAQWSAAPIASGGVLNKILTVAQSFQIPAPGSQVTAKVNEVIDWVQPQNGSTAYRGDYLNLENVGQFRVIGTTPSTKQMVLEYIALADAPNNTHQGELAGAGTRFTQGSWSSTTKPVSGKLYIREFATTDQSQTFAQNPVSLSGQAPGSVNWGRCGITTGFSISTFVTGCGADSSGNGFETGYASTPGSTDKIDFGDGTPIFHSLNEANGFIVKYNSAGVALKMRALLATYANAPRAVAIDSLGNVIVVGNFSGPCDFGGITKTSYLVSAPNNYAANMFVAKYDNDLNLIWVQPFGGSNQEIAYGVDVTSDNSIIVCGLLSSANVAFGSTILSADGQDVVLFKLNSSGDVQWAKKYGGTGNQRAWALAVNRAASDNKIVITGFASGSTDLGRGTPVNTSGQDVFVAKYDASGNWLWDVIVGSTSTDYGFGIALEPVTHHVIITGSAGGAINFGVASINTGGIFTAKFDWTTGVNIWAKCPNEYYGTFSSFADRGAAVAADQITGLIYLVGVAYNTVVFGSVVVGPTAHFIVCYNSSGVVQWAKRARVATGGGVALGAASVFAGVYFQGTMYYDQDDASKGYCDTPAGTTAPAFIQYSK